jgi:hypothetical protein
LDSETLYETLFEILNNWQYQHEAKDLFRDELGKCTDLDNEQKVRIMDLVMTFDSASKCDTGPVVEEILTLLLKSELFYKFVVERLKNGEINT